MKFDIIVGNPPYNNGIDLKFLKLSLKLKPEHLVFVHPSTYMIDRKGGKRYNNIKELLYNKLISADLFNGNPIFGIGLFVPCVIIYYSKNYNGPCAVNYFGDKYTSDTYNITKFGKQWKTIVEPFMNKMKIICAIDNLHTKRITK